MNSKISICCDDKLQLNDGRCRRRAHHHLRAGHHGNLLREDRTKAARTIRHWVSPHPDYAGWAVVRTDDSVEAEVVAAAVVAEACMDGSAQGAVEAEVVAEA